MIRKIAGDFNTKAKFSTNWQNLVYKKFYVKNILNVTKAVMDGVQWENWGKAHKLQFEKNICEKVKSCYSTRTFSYCTKVMRHKY